MKTCLGCKWAKWDKTKNGRLHPSGDGQCTYQVKIPKLPKSMRWLYDEPRVSAGIITRKSDFEDDCIYYERGVCK